MSVKQTFEPLAEDDVLSALYQSQLEPQPFKSFLSALEERLGLVIASIDVGIGKNNLPPVSIIHYPVPEADVLKLLQTNERLWRHYPRKTPLHAGDIYQLAQVISSSGRGKNPYVQELMAPFGIENELIMAVSGPDNVLCLLRLAVDGETVFSERHEQFLRSLRPHLERALVMHMHIRRPASIINMFETVSDHLNIGFFILNGHAQVIQSNHMAKTLIKESPLISLQDNRLHFPKAKELNKTYTEFIREAIAWRREAFHQCLVMGFEKYESRHEHTPAQVFRLAYRDENHIDILVQPLKPSYSYRNETSAQLIVHAIDNKRQLTPPEKLVMQLYDLTYSEARFAIMLANGYSISDAADRLGLTQGSARTYSKKIYAKTGISRQAELVQLLLKSVVLLTD